MMAQGPAQHRLGIDGWIAATLLAVMALIAFVNILGRYLFHYSLAFTEELTINLFVWLTVVGSGIAFERGSQLGMVSLFRVFPRRVQRGRGCWTGSSACCRSCGSSLAGGPTAPSGWPPRSGACVPCSRCPAIPSWLSRFESLR